MEITSYLSTRRNGKPKFANIRLEELNVKLPVPVTTQMTSPGKRFGF